MDQYTNYNYNGGRSAVSDARRSTSLSALAIAGVFLLSSVAQIILHTVVSIAYPALMENDWYMWALSILPMYAFAMPLCYLFVRALPKSVPQKQSVHPLAWFGFLSLCFALSFAASYLGQIISAWLSELTGIGTENQLEEMTVNTSLGVNILFVGILAPIFEELFYRKVIIDRLHRYGDLPAILLSGLAFGLVHGNLNQVFYATAIGMLLGYIYVRTGSVLYTISIHSAFNMIGGVFSTEIIRRMGEDSMPALDDMTGWIMLLAYSMFCVFAIVVSVIFLGVAGRRFRTSLQEGECTLTFGQWLRALIFNPGIWVFLFVIFLLFI